jgi:hypothetical protein
MREEVDVVVIGMGVGVDETVSGRQNVSRRPLASGAKTATVPMSRPARATAGTRSASCAAQTSTTPSSRQAPPSSAGSRPASAG